jgi:hypothetical protein
MEVQRTNTQFGEWDFWTQGLDRRFFSHVYLRSGQIGAVAALIALGFEQRVVAAGLVCGIIVGMASLWTAEMTVRLLLNGGRNAGIKLAIASCVKLPFGLAALLAIAWAGLNGFLNIFAVVGGVLIVHLTMLVLVIAAAAANQERCRERYR